MKLDEIYLMDKTTKASVLWQWGGDHSKYRLRTNKKNILLATEGDVTVLFYPDDVDVIATVKGKDALVLNLMHGNEGGNTYTVETLKMNPLYAAYGLPLFCYKAFIMKGYTLVSGSSQTYGSKKIWDSLQKDPDIHVYIYDSTDADKKVKDAEDYDEDAIYKTASPSGEFSADIVPFLDIRLVAVKR